MQAIPLQAVPSQIVRVVLNNQNCTIAINTKTTGLFCDLSIDGNVIWTCAICQNNNPICSYGYLGFIGSLVFLDTVSNTDPVYTGFGGTTAQYQLLYLMPGEGAT